MKGSGLDGLLLVFALVGALVVLALLTGVVG